MRKEEKHFVFVFLHCKPRIVCIKKPFISVIKPLFYEKTFISVIKPFQKPKPLKKNLYF